MDDRKQRLISLLEELRPDETIPDEPRTVTLNDDEIMLLVPILYDAVVTAPELSLRKEYHALFTKLLI